MNRISNDTPNGEVVVLIDSDRLEFGVMGNKPGAAIGVIDLKLLKGIFAVYEGNDKIPVLGFKAAIDDHDIAIEDTGIAHGVSFHMGVESGLGVRCHFPGEIDTFPRMIRCRRRKTGVNGFGEFQGQFSLFGISYIYQFTHTIL